MLVVGLGILFEGNWHFLCRVMYHQLHSNICNSPFPNECWTLYIEQWWLRRKVGCECLFFCSTDCCGSLNHNSASLKLVWALLWLSSAKFGFKFDFILYRWEKDVFLSNSAPDFPVYLYPRCGFFYSFIPLYDKLQLPPAQDLQI